MRLAKKCVEKTFLKCIEEHSFLGYTENRQQYICTAVYKTGRSQRRKACLFCFFFNKGKETGKFEYTSRGRMLWNIKKVRLKKW